MLIVERVPMPPKFMFGFADEPDPEGTYTDSDPNDSDATCPEDFDS